MKKIKATIAIILAVVMCFSSAPLTAFAVTKPAIPIEVGTATAVIENPGDRAIFSFTPTESGKYSLTSYSSTDTIAFLYDSNPYDGNIDHIAEDDDGGNESNFYLSYDFEAGNTYYFAVLFYDHSTNGSIPIELIKHKTIKSIAIDTLPYKTEYIEHYVYEGIDLEGLVLTFTWQDDSTDTWSYVEGENFNGVSLGINVEYEGETLSIILDYDGVQTSFPITTIPNPVQSIEIIDNGYPDLTEYSNGVWQEYWDNQAGHNVEFYYYNYFEFLENLSVKINYSDGRDAETYPLENSENFEIAGQTFDASTEQYGKPWSKGSENNTITFEYAGKTATYNVNIVDSPVESIEIIENTDATIFENSDGWEDVAENGDPFFYYDCHSSYYFLDKFSIKINYNDGSEPNIKNLWQAINEGIDGTNVNKTENQHQSPWVVGGQNNTITFEYMGATTTYNVNIVANPVAGIEIIDNGAPKIFEQTNGFWDQRQNPDTGEYEDFYYYSNYHDILDKLELKITYNDGREPEYKGLFNNDDDGIDVTYSTEQYSEPWVVGGKNNTITITYLGFSDTYNVEIIKNPVESIEIIDDGFPTLVEEESGYWTSYSDQEPYFYYNYGQYLPLLSLKINYSDGRDPYIQPLGSGIILDTPVSDYSNQDEQPWTVGGTENLITVSYLGMEATYNVNIKKSPVEKIEIIDNGFPALYKEGSGYWDTALNEETGEEEPYFYYQYYDQLDKLSLKVTYNDGRAPLVQKLEYDGYNDEILVDGKDVLATSYQSSKEWSIGADDNLIVFKYMGAQTTYNVKITENPVEKIEIIENGDAFLYENGSGYWNEYWDHILNKEVSYFWYDYYMLFNKLSLKVTYNDGRAPVIKPLSYDDLNIIDGNYVNYYSSQDLEHWIKGGENNKITFEYLGAKCDYNVKIVDNPVDRIEVIDNGFPTFEVETNGTWEGNFEYYSYNYHDYLDKFTVKIYYKDGRAPATIKLNKDYSLQIPVDGYCVDYADIQHSNPWGVDGENTITFTYLGAKATYDVKINKSDVTGIEILNGPTKNSYISDQVIPNYIGMKFKVTTADGSQEITVSEQNIRYTRYGLSTVNVLIGDKYATIQTIDGVTTISYLGMQATAKNLITFADLYIVGVKVESFNEAGTIKMELSCKDGSKEYVTTKVLKQHGLEEFGYGIGSGNSFDQYFIAQTELGIIYYNLYKERQSGPYYLHIFGLPVVLNDNQLSYTAGDIDDSGDVNLDDVVALAQVVAGWQGVSHNASALDVNSDGNTNLDDVVLLAQFVAGWNVNLP